MVYKAYYSPAAERDLERAGRDWARRILGKIDEYLKLKNPLLKAKKLKGLDAYRFRIGDYRAIFKIDQQSGVLTILVILKIAHRKDAYK